MCKKIWPGTRGHLDFAHPANSIATLLYIRLYCKSDFDRSRRAVCLIDSEGEAERPCRKQADVLFLIDATSSIDYEYWKTYVLGFVGDVIRQLNVDNGRTRLAVISYSDTAKVRQAHVYQDESV